MRWTSGVPSPLRGYKLSGFGKDAIRHGTPHSANNGVESQSPGHSRILGPRHAYGLTWEKTRDDYSPGSRGLAPSNDCSPNRVESQHGEAVAPALGAGRARNRGARNPQTARTGGHRPRDCRADFSPPSGAFFKQEADLKPHLTRDSSILRWRTPTSLPSTGYRCPIGTETPPPWRTRASPCTRVTRCGIPAREQKHPPLPRVPENVERREFE